MNERERFLAALHGLPRDRCPIVDFSFWDETLPEWHTQGLPTEVTLQNSDHWFGMDSLGWGPPIANSLCPSFEWQVLEDLGTEEIVRDWQGVTFRWQKTMKSIPLYMDHTLKDRESWEKEFLPRLDPDSAARVDPKFLERVEEMKSPDWTTPVVVHGGSLYGWIRDWMGVEEVSYLVYDDPALFEEMVEQITLVQESSLRRVLETGLKVDACSMWEDMCYSGGPLLTPSLFKQILAPRYRRIADLLLSYGVDIIYLDCDGKIDELVPTWLESGINTMFPIEVGTWGADPVKMRKEYGPDLKLMGGFDKHILAKGTAEISLEVQRLAPLVEEGGFIPFPDHRVPPDVPYSNYLHYLDEARRIWGGDTHLKPILVPMT
jgi:uroporphyrinogen-III decarboxylase